MKRLSVLAVGVFMAISLAAAANAAPMGVPGKATPQKGVKNARKAMQGKIERDKKVNEARKRGLAMKHQAQGGN